MSTASSRGRNNKQRAKGYERNVARILGGKRHLADTGGKEDVAHDVLSIQVKSGLAVANNTIRTGLDAARAAATPGKLPVLVLVDRSGARLRMFAVCDLGEFADWHGFSSKEEDNE